MKLFVFFSVALFSVLAGEEKLPRKWSEIIANEEAIQKTFDHLEGFLADAKKSKRAFVYEGLPRQLQEKEKLKNEKEPKHTVARYGFLFYQAPQAVDEKNLKLFKGLLAETEAYRRFTGFKRCGGFHPDYLVRFGAGEAAIFIQLCYGCGEARIFRKGEMVYGDLAKMNKIKLLMKQFVRHRIEE